MLNARAAPGASGIRDSTLREQGAEAEAEEEERREDTEEERPEAKCPHACPHVKSQDPYHNAFYTPMPLVGL